MLPARPMNLLEREEKIIITNSILRINLQLFSFSLVDFTPLSTGGCSFDDRRAEFEIEERLRSPSGSLPEAEMRKS